MAAIGISMGRAATAQCRMTRNINAGAGTVSRQTLRSIRTATPARPAAEVFSPAIITGFFETANSILNAAPTTGRKILARSGLGGILYLHEDTNHLCKGDPEMKRTIALLIAVAFTLAFSVMLARNGPTKKAQKADSIVAASLTAPVVNAPILVRDNVPPLTAGYDVICNLSETKTTPETATRG